MTRREHHHLKRVQQSVRYSFDQARADPALKSRPQYLDSAYPHMLIEDVSLSIAPIGGRSRRAFRVAVQPVDDRSETLIAEALDGDAHHTDVTSSVCDFIRECARMVMAYGEASYEIIYLVDPQAGTRVAFELEQILPWSLIHRRGQIVQHVPERVARERGLPRHIVIDPDRLITFQLPPRLRHRWSTMMSSLDAVGLGILPDFALASMRSGGRSVPFDTEAHLRTRHMALAEATSAIGWNARWSFDGDVLEYYLLDRQLTFEQFKIELRDEILATLNVGLRRIGTEMGFRAQVVLEGLPTLTDVVTARERLSSGNIAFKELTDPFSLL